MLFLLVALTTTGCVSAKRVERSAVRTDLGEAYLTEGSTELAIESLQEAIRLDRRNAQAWDSLGLALMKRGAHEDAERAFKRAVRLDPDDASYRLNYAYLLQKLGRPAEAIVQLERAREDLTYRQPAKVLNNLGMAYLAVGRTDEGVAVLEEALFRQPNACAIRYNLAVAYEQQQSLDKAADVLEDVMVACESDYPESVLLRGIVLMDMGRQEEGAMYLQLAMDRYAGTDVAREAEARLQSEGMR